MSIAMGPTGGWLKVGETNIGADGHLDLHAAMALSRDSGGITGDGWVC